jgi:hypothetical protein
MEDPKDEDIDLTAMSREQVLTGVGDLLMTMLGSNRLVVVATSKRGAITFLNPLLSQYIPPEEMARVLLESWDEEEVEEFLSHVYE